MFQFSVLIYIYDLSILRKITVVDVKSHLQSQLFVSGNAPDRICIIILLIVFLADGVCQFLCRHGGFLFPVTVSASPCSLTRREHQRCGSQQGNPCSVIFSFHKLFPLMRLPFTL